MEAVSSPTPSPSPAMPSGAPPTSAPSPEITPGQRPTFDQVFAADAAPSTPESQPAAESATTQPGETTTTESATHPSTQGPPPDKWPAILDNARVKAKADAQAEFDRDFGWARQVPRETIQEWSGIANLMASDPPAFLDKFFSEAATHPTHGAAVRSWAARTLASRAPKAVDLSPDVTVQDDQGREVARTFSADRVQAIVQHAVHEAIGKEITPLKQESDERKAAQAKQAQEQRATETRQRLEAQADGILADLAAILEITADTPPDQAKALYDELDAALAADAALTPHKAAMHLRQTRITPALQGKAQQQVLDDLNKKAAAQGFNPARTGHAPAHRPQSFQDPSLKW